MPQQLSNTSCAAWLVYQIVRAAGSASATWIPIWYCTLESRTKSPTRPWRSRVTLQIWHSGPGTRLAPPLYLAGAYRAVTPKRGGGAGNLRIFASQITTRLGEDSYQGKSFLDFGLRKPKPGRADVSGVGLPITLTFPSPAPLLPSPFGLRLFQSMCNHYYSAKPSRFQHHLSFSSLLSDSFPNYHPRPLVIAMHRCVSTCLYERKKKESSTRLTWSYPFPVTVSFSREPQYVHK